MLLDTGRTAALGSERWETALALNAERVKVKLRAAPMRWRWPAPASTITFPCSPCAAYDDARALLLSCRAIFEAERDIEVLGASTAPWPTWKRDRRPGRGRALRGGRPGLHYRPASPNTAPSTTTTWPSTWSARAPTRPPSWPTAWRRPPSACRCSPACCLQQCTTWRSRTCPPPRLPSPTWSSAWRPSRACASGAVRASAPHRPRRRRRPRRRLADGGGREETPGRRQRRRDEERQRQDAVLAAAPAAVRAASEREGDERNAALNAALAEMPEAEAAAVNDEGLRPDRAGTRRTGAKGLAADRGRPPHLGRRAGRGGAHRRTRLSGQFTHSTHPATTGAVTEETPIMDKDTYLILRVTGDDRDVADAISTPTRARRARSNRRGTSNIASMRRNWTGRISSA